MKFVKYILLGFGSLLALYFVCCILGPSDMNTSKSITIAASPDKIFASLSDFQKWGDWSPWAKKDPEMKNTFEGTPAQVGHKQSWISPKMGNGTQTILEIEAPNRIKTELSFDGFDKPSHSQLILQPEGNNTKLTWTMEDSDVPFLFRGMMLIMGGKDNIEKDFEEGLNNLKSLAEKP